MNIDHELLRRQAVAVERAIDRAPRKDKDLLEGVAELLAFLQIREANNR